MRPHVEIINTGSELILGNVLNTHQQWLCAEFTALGLTPARQLTVSDSAQDIAAALSEALTRADLIITTGGLGPTADDRTRDCLAELLGRPLREDQETLSRIEQFFTTRNRPMPRSTRVQALVPEGAVILRNDHGTAPGLLIEVPGSLRRSDGGRCVVVMLPGPPRELYPMFKDQVIPWLRTAFPGDASPDCKIFRTTGLGESLVEERIAPLLSEFEKKGLEIGYCARVGEVDVRLRGNQAVVSEAARVVEQSCADIIFGTGDQTLHQAVVTLLREKRKTLALAESCTGGFISHRITNVPGASEVFLAGYVTYSNPAKKDVLSVQASTLEQFGAVSEEVALEMADGARKRSGADIAVAVTGIAGPGGGTAQKPVGTVYIALSSGGARLAKRYLNPYDRETFKFTTSQQALNMVRRRTG